MIQRFGVFTALLFALVSALATPSSAHDLGLAQVTVSQAPDGSIGLRAKLSATLDAAAPRARGGCTADSRVRMAPDGQNQIVQTRLDCPQGLTGSSVLLPWKVDGVFLRTGQNGGETATRFLPAGPDGVRLALDGLLVQDRSALETAWQYLGLGVEHILIGVDHLALLLCLSLLARGMALLRLATAFTVGHSVTLIVAALYPSLVPIAPVEVLIVISVAWLAREVWMGRTMDRNSTALLVGIGLLHGLGFASALGEIGLPKAQLVAALLSFNIGVEIGQLMFLSAAIALPWGIARLVPLPSKIPYRMLSAFLLGSVAMYWTIERLTGFYV